jgi:hypothetical protein
MIDGNALINTEAHPEHYSYRRLMAMEAQAYHEMVPYPMYGLFKEWKESERGPIPKCRTLARDLAKDSARWLFGKCPKIKVEDEKAQEFINRVIDENRLPAMLQTWATRAFFDGGASFAWSFDADKQEQGAATGVQINPYSVSQHSRFYYDPHDPRKLLMARIQYVYWDTSGPSGEWMVRRIDITDDYIQQYEDLQLKVVWQGAYLGQHTPGVQQLVDMHKGWVTAERLDNAAGLIPVKEVKSVDTGMVYGEGDMWRYWRLFDVMNLTYTIESIDNQISAWPHRIYIDLKPESGDEPQAVGPDSAEVLESLGEKQGKVQQLETAGAIRQHIAGFSERLEKELRSVVGYPKVDAAEITNKGNLTAAVMKQVYAPHIATTEEKRRLWTEQMLTPFFEDMLRGLKNADHPEAKKFADELTVEVEWPGYFSETSEELKMFVEVQSLMVASGYTTRERAVQEIATMRNVDDIPQLLEDIENAPEEEVTESQEAAAAEGQGSGTGKREGANSDSGND